MFWVFPPDQSALLDSPSSKTEGKCFRLARFARRRGRLNSVSLIKPNPGIELLCGLRLEVMRCELALRSVDDADRAFEQRPRQLSAQRIVLLHAEIEEEGRHLTLATVPLERALVCGTHRLNLHRSVPIRCRSDRSAIGTKADQGSLGTELVSAQLAQVEFSAHMTHLGEGGVADVRVVRPYHRLRIGTAMGEEGLERIEHVLIAQVPGGGRAVVHGAVVALGLSDDASVLLRIEEALVVVPEVGETLAEQIPEHGDNVGLARLEARAQ